VKVRIADLGATTALSYDDIDVEAYVPWRLISPIGDESCRWTHRDGRWVALTLGCDDEIGRVVVTDSSGRRELVDAYESALALARHWRT
jgi:hypothetical protein